MCLTDLLTRVAVFVIIAGNMCEAQATTAECSDHTYVEQTHVMDDIKKAWIEMRSIHESLSAAINEQAYSATGVIPTEFLELERLCVDQNMAMEWFVNVLRFLSDLEGTLKRLRSDEIIMLESPRLTSMRKVAHCYIKHNIDTGRYSTEIGGYNSAPNGFLLPANEQLSEHQLAANIRKLKHLVGEIHYNFMRCEKLAGGLNKRAQGAFVLYDDYGVALRDKRGWEPAQNAIYQPETKRVWDELMMEQQQADKRDSETFGQAPERWAYSEQDLERARDLAYSLHQREQKRKRSAVRLTNPFTF